MQKKMKKRLPWKSSETLQILWMIKFTVDYPGNHKSGKIPILDIQASINKKEQNKIEFKF